MKCSSGFLFGKHLKCYIIVGVAAAVTLPSEGILHCTCGHEILEALHVGVASRSGSTRLCVGVKARI